MPDLLRRALRSIIDLGSRSRPRIFISYRRRGEGAGYAGRLADRLIHEFGDRQCFRDIDDIESGTDFVEEISRAVGGCEVLIVVIGPDWLDARDRDGLRRLDDPRDFVRIEIAAALARNIRVVPVLVGGAAVPSPEKLPSSIDGLSRRQAHELSDTRWDYDVGQLITAIEGMGVRRRSKQGVAGTRPWKRAGILAGSIGAAALIALSVANGALAGWMDGDLDRYSSSVNDNSLSTSGDPDRLKGTNDVLQRAVDQLASHAVRPAGSDSRSDGNGDASPGARTVALPLDDAPADAWRDQIIAALRRANEAETQAQRSLDGAGLEDGFTGDALQLEIYALGALRLSGERAINRLHDQRILSIDVSDDESHAVVEAIETWSSMRVDAVSDECLYRQGAQPVPQTVHLVRVQGRWTVSALATRGEEPQQLPCG